MSQSRENLWTDGRTDEMTEGWKDGQTLFYRTLLAEARGPKILVQGKKYVQS